LRRGEALAWRIQVQYEEGGQVRRNDIVTPFARIRLKTAPLRLTLLGKSRLKAGCGQDCPPHSSY
jgi:hypothetical protein